MALFWRSANSCLSIDAQGLNTAADLCYDQAVAPRPPMSEEQLKAFEEKVKADTSLQEKLNAPTTPEAVIEIAKDAGFSITAEDIQSMQSQSGEVSDRELEEAAGGLTVIAGALQEHNNAILRILKQ